MNNGAGCYMAAQGQSDACIKQYHMIENNSKTLASASIPDACMQLQLPLIMLMQSGARQLQLGWEGSSPNEAFAPLVRSGESAQINVRRPDVMTWCDMAPWQPSHHLYQPPDISR